MSELNIPGFIAFLRGEVTIDGHWFGGDGPIRGGIRRNFWWREHLPKLSAHIERQDAEIAQLRADLSESRRLLDEARAVASEYLSARGACEIPHGHALPKPRRYNEPEIVRYRSAITALTNIALSAPVPAQPAGGKGSTHCDDCGCDWLDNGLNPVGCPYCKRNDDKFNPCLNSLVRQVTLMMDDCEEHADGTITIDCDISQGFLRRIYDLLSALEDGGYDAIEPQQPAAVPEAVAHPSARTVAVSWCALKHSTKKDLIKSFDIVCPQGKTETDLSWSIRAIDAMCGRPECVAAILSAADDEVKNG